MSAGTGTHTHRDSDQESDNALVRKRNMSGMQSRRCFEKRAHTHTTERIFCDFSPAHTPRHMLYTAAEWQSDIQFSTPYTGTENFLALSSLVAATLTHQTVAFRRKSKTIFDHLSVKRKVSTN